MAVGTSQRTMTPAGLLVEADHLLTGNFAGERAVWPRACAILIRTALEIALDEYWARTLPEVVGCPTRPQLLLLAETVGRDTAERATEAWTGLSRATHHHAYELCPTANELRGWGEMVGRVIVDLSKV
jgi:hypothetical protein